MNKKNWRKSVNNIVLLTLFIELVIGLILICDNLNKNSEIENLWLIGSIFGPWIALRSIIHYIGSSKSKKLSAPLEENVLVPEIIKKYWKNWVILAFISSLFLIIILPEGSGFISLILAFIELITFYYIKKWKETPQEIKVISSNEKREVASTTEMKQDNEEQEIMLKDEKPATIDFFPTRWFRKSTFVSIIILLILGSIVLIGEVGANPDRLINFWSESWAGLNILLIGIGEIGLLVILQVIWNSLTKSKKNVLTGLWVPLLIVALLNITLLVAFNRFSNFFSIITQIWTFQVMIIIIISIILILGIFLLIKRHSLDSFLGYVFLGYFFAMVMEFCVDYGAYGIYPWRNGEMVQIVMLGLSLHYFAFVAIFRLWYHFFDFSPKEAYLAMGTTGFILEFFILPIIAGSYNFWLIILFPFYYFINVFNYGSIVVIPTLFHQNSDLKNKTKPLSNVYIKYLVSVGGTLLLGLIEIIFFYSVLFGVF